MSTNLLLSENEKFKVVAAKFVNDLHNKMGRAYSFRSVHDLEVGDKAIVLDNAGELQIVVVVDEDLFNGIATKWIVQKIDMATYDNCVEVTRGVEKKLKALKRLRLRKELEESLSEILGEDGVEDVKSLIKFD